LVLTLNWIQLYLSWSHRSLWSESADLVPVLSMTGLAASLAIAVTLGLVALGGRIRWQDLGLTPPQLAIALLIGGAAWACTQAVQLVDVAWYGRSAPRAMDIAGAFLSAYSEELIYRLVVIGGMATLLRRWMQPRQALRLAVLLSVALFALSHIPHDLAWGLFWRIERYPALLAYGALMSLIYLVTGNLMTAALLHMLSNEPIVTFGGPHLVMHATTVNLSACIAVLVWHGWRGRSRDRHREPRLNRSGDAP
jgi:membrane protease YdiL (CAAX protease family)